MDPESEKTQAELEKRKQMLLSHLEKVTSLDALVIKPK